MPNDRWTESELAEHYERLKTRAGAAGLAPLGAEKCEDTLEAPIQEEVTRILESDGWRALRTEPVSDRGRGKGFGEIGMPDFLYMRYGAGTVEPWKPLGLLAEGCEILWIEHKRRRGGVVSKDQILWHQKERARGALTLIAGVDFDASVQGFCRWYENSGLMRHKPW